MQFCEIIAAKRVYDDIKYGLINNKNNPRFNINNILKHKDANTDLFYYVLKDNNIGYLALIGIITNPLKTNIADNYSIANFQSLYHGKGYGLKLLDHTIDIFKNIWLMADPSQEKSLVEYYRNNPKLKEFILDNSVYDKPLHFYYSINFDKRITKNLLSYIKQMFGKQNYTV